MIVTALIVTFLQIKRKKNPKLRTIHISDPKPKVRVCLGPDLKKSFF